MTKGKSINNMENETELQKRISRYEKITGLLIKLSCNWSKEALPVLTKILTEDPSALEKLYVPKVVFEDIYWSNGEYQSNPIWGSMKARRERNNSYSLQDMGRPGQQYIYDARIVNLKEAAEEISSGLLNYYCGVHCKRFETNTYRNVLRIPETERHRLITNVMKHTGKNLKEEVRKAKGANL